MNNFTPRAQQVLALARKEADRFNHNFVGTEHLLLGLIKLGQGVAVNVLQKLGLDLETVRMEVEKQVGTGPDQKMIGNIPYTPASRKSWPSPPRKPRRSIILMSAQNTSSWAFFAKGTALPPVFSRTWTLTSSRPARKSSRNSTPISQRRRNSNRLPVASSLKNRPQPRKKAMSKPRR